MVDDLKELQRANGAEVAESSLIPLSFGNDIAAKQAAATGVAICDRSHWGRILVSDSDRLRFLHNQTTNDFEKLKPGEGCDTVFVTSTARTIDLVAAYVLEDAVLLLTSPNRAAKLVEWMDRYIFFADKVKLEDLASTTFAFSLMGDRSNTILQQLGWEVSIDKPYGSHQLYQLAGEEVRVAVGSGLATPGYTLIAQTSQAASLWQELVNLGAIPLGENVWEQLRIEQGRPVPDAELTEEYNPLEAGLWKTISFEKGCYIGQETIARLNTYKGVKLQLWGVRLEGSAIPGTAVTSETEKIGKLTSCTQTETGHFGLTYIRTKAGNAGLSVRVGDTTGELVPVPFVEYLESIDAKED
jgi:tRNA-modifying protein YgfZ